MSEEEIKEQIQPTELNVNNKETESVEHNSEHTSDIPERLQLSEDVLLGILSSPTLSDDALTNICSIVASRVSSINNVLSEYQHLLTNLEEFGNVTINNREQIIRVVFITLLQLADKGFTAKLSKNVDSVHL